MNNNLTVNFFYEELKKRVSATNAKLLIHNAILRTGIQQNPAMPLEKHEAQALCMELIRVGGPGFQVGRSVYSQILQ